MLTRPFSALLFLQIITASISVSSKICRRFGRWRVINSDMIIDRCHGDLGTPSSNNPFLSGISGLPSHCMSQPTNEWRGHQVKVFFSACEHTSRERHMQCKYRMFSFSGMFFQESRRETNLILQVRLCLWLWLWQMQGHPLTIGPYHPEGDTAGVKTIRFYLVI